jgi:hypothetical protein
LTWICWNRASSSHLPTCEAAESTGRSGMRLE